MLSKVVIHKLMRRCEKCNNFTTVYFDCNDSLYRINLTNKKTEENRNQQLSIIATIFFCSLFILPGNRWHTLIHNAINFKVKENQIEDAENGIESQALRWRNWPLWNKRKHYAISKEVSRAWIMSKCVFYAIKFNKIQKKKKIESKKN